MEGERRESERRKIRVDLRYGLGGHEDHYVLTTPYDGDYIPDKISDEIQQKLGDEWDVVNRGTRLEIRSNTENLQDDDTVRKATKEALGETHELYQPADN